LWGDEKPVITVLHVVDLGGPNAWLNGVASTHDRMSFRHLVASLGPRCGLHESLEARGIEAWALAATSYRQTAAAVWRLARLLRRERVDIVQTHLFHPTTVGLLAAVAARTPLRIVTRHHSDFTTIFRRPVHRQIDRFHALFADHVMAASLAVKRAMTCHERVPASKIVVTPYGYDFTTLRPRLTPERRRDIRAQLGGDDLLIVTTARLSVEKGHEYLFQSIPRIVEQQPRTRVLLLGTGPLREQLEQRARTLGIQRHVRFLGWRDDALNIMEAADLVVHPTLHEAFCSVIIEAMALERPLIATSVAAAPEQIDHDETGLLVPARDPEAIAWGVIQMIQDPTRAARLGREARRRVVERFNFPRMMREYEHWYAEWFRARRLPRRRSDALRLPTSA
jgi:glycosyltransferase involved in cell wall biosynthesis